jgi:hypothetical protein
MTGTEMIQLTKVVVAAVGLVGFVAVLDFDVQTVLLDAIN